MRLDLIEKMKIKDNWSLARIAKENKCDYRTVKKYKSIKLKDFEQNRKQKYEADEIQSSIKVELKRNPRIHASDIHRLLLMYYPQREISERQIRRRVAYEKDKLGLRANIPLRLNYMPGKEIQVDWKESLKVKTYYGNEIKLNILGLKLPYSGRLAFEVTEDRKTNSLLNALTRGLIKLGGTPEEMKFDNMKTVVVHQNAYTTNKIYTNKIIQFGNDFNIEIKTTETYNPQGKGSVETQMKLVESVKALNGKVGSLEDIKAFVQMIEDKRNTQVILNEQLSPLPNSKILKLYENNKKKIKVARDSMICVDGYRYSVNPMYIGAKLWIENGENKINIYDDYGKLIRAYQKNIRKINYKLEDFHEIITQPKYLKYKPAYENIDTFVMKQFEKLKGI